MCWPVILLSKWSFYTATYVPQLQNQHFILHGILGCVLVGIIYPGPRWTIYTSRNTWGFYFSLPTLHSRQSCVHSFSYSRARWLLTNCLLLPSFFREPVPGMPAWTGPGFAMCSPGDGLRFAVGNIPVPMDFTVAIRYETQAILQLPSVLVVPAERNTFSS